MRDKDLLVYGAGAGLLALAVWQRGTVVDVVKRGRKLTDAPVGSSGKVDMYPAALAAEASRRLGRNVATTVYAGARMVRSEGSSAARVRMHVAINDANELGWDLLRLFTYSTADWARGWFGAQFTPAVRDALGKLVREKSVRRYATSKDPYEGDVVAVEQALAEHQAGIDPTGGAVKFVDKSSFGVQTGTGSYAEIVQRWGADGLRPFNVPGYSDDLVVFRRVG